MKKCPVGQYYCFTDKKCKEIPMGYHVGGRGMLEPDEETPKKKNGNENGGNGNGSNGGSMGEDIVHEGGSLHTWFKDSKSKDGKPGWVQSDGSPCANEPGETKTPKCYSSKRLAALKRKGKKGENIIKSADRRKREKDPGQQSKSGAAKPTNVKTFAKGKKDKNYVKPEPGLKEMVEAKDHEHSMIRSELSTVMNAARRLKKKMGKGEGNVEAWVQSKITKAADYLDSAADYIDSGEHDIEEATKDIKGKGSGKKDACYDKVKSRYRVWPSAYASGALVKCRKVGAANWGNKSEETDYELDEKIDLTKQSSKRKSLGRGSSIAQGAKKTGYESPSEFRKTEKKLAPYMKENEQIDEKCWPGYEKKGMKTMFGKRYPNCVKKKKTTSEATSFDINPSEHKKAQKQQKIRNMTKSPNKNEADVAKKMTRGPELANEAVRVPTKTGNIIASTISFRGKYYMLKMFFPQVIKPTRAEVQAQVEKVYPGARLASYVVSDYKPGEPVFHTEDWQSVNRKDKTDGLSQKAVDAYRRENPGSKLQTAVTEKKPTGKRAERRKSFCRRMKGMKSKLTSSKTARDPDSRINKALRRWNCN